MADGGDRKSLDFYKILGLEKECTPTELKNAYRKLAKIWHPDRCSASGDLKFVEEAKMKFQAIQEAYSVLSDETKRFLYDVGVYDNNDDDNNHGMGDFLNEMVTMMSEHQPTENGGESFEQLQEMFEEMFQRDSLDSFASTSQGMDACCSSYASSIDDGPFIVNKRNSSEMNKTEASPSFNIDFQSFCVGDELDGSRKIITSFW
ncbi:Chaperone protein DnaJ [Bienertia sinuspersici]